MTKSPGLLSSILSFSDKTWAFLALRLFLSLRFLFTGLIKFERDGTFSFGNYTTNAEAMTQSFVEKTILPKLLVLPYTYAIGIVEVILGLALFLGILSRWTLIAHGLVYASLAVGLMLQRDTQLTTNIGLHVLIVAAALALVSHNRLELIPDRHQ